ncbi:hypothetical protein M413DRAFT_67581 [Hebeloma cylindrosporum]|uniref:5'-deoxynucleotidase n=1 Tax=Hebeloma cylindrosporum TaxID=76867 RepID=A0A0C3CLV7_HEBCY|nr:hypothetical protein M413DRAFT_67581 [Hebeloma cylindrosporum h7]
MGLENTPLSSKRIFPPLYVATGDSSRDKLAFIHILERLKTQKRTGWVNHKVEQYCCTRSISDHMYRMAILAMLSDDPKLDVSKCVMMALVHDIAEAQGKFFISHTIYQKLGDITPWEGIPKAEKHRLEAEAMHNFVHDMLHNSPAAQRIESLWREYEEGQTEEAKFVKDLDNFELASQALEYETNHGASTLQSFFDSSIPKLRHPQIQGWAEELMSEREQLKKDNSNSTGKQ